MTDSARQPPSDGSGRSRTGRSNAGRSNAGRSNAGRSQPDASRLEPAALERSALAYLNRYDASVVQLRRVLQRQIARHAPDDASREAALRATEDLLQRYQRSRLLDDARYAEALARGLRARGTSAARIRLKLKQRGISEELIEQALGELDQRGAVDDGGEPLDPEVAAALAYAKRRRLARRHDLDDPASRQKALAALGRQGFSFGVAREALERARADNERG